MRTETSQPTERELRKILTRRRARLRCELEAVEQLLTCLTGNRSDLSAAIPQETGADDYGSLRPQNAALRLLQESPGKKWRASEAAEKLKELGVKSASRTFSSLISAALMRLAERRLIVREMEGRRPVYVFRGTASGAIPASGNGSDCSEV